MTMIEARQWVHLHLDDGRDLPVYVDADHEVGVHLDDQLIIRCTVSDREQVAEIAAALRDLAHALRTTPFPTKRRAAQYLDDLAKLVAAL